MENYEILSKRIEDTFNKLEETITSVNLLKETVNTINSATDQLVDAIRVLSENDNTKKLINDHNQISKTIRNDIGKVANNLQEIETYRSYFQNEIASFNKRINNFSESFDKKAEIASNTNKQLAKMVSKVINDQNINNSSRNRLTKLAEEIDLFSHYEQVKKEQEEQRKLLQEILKTLKK